MDVTDVLLVAVAYLAGSVPFAYIVAKSVGGIDIRAVGSGNVGATNVGRVLGRKWGVLVLALDMIKGFLPVLAGQMAHGRTPFNPGLPAPVLLIGLAAIVGHNWPVFLKFRGGKGMATGCGVFLGIFPLGVAISLAVWLAAVGLTRYVSVGSILAAVAMLICALTIPPAPFGEGKHLTLCAGLVAILSIWRHRSNIRRLAAGTENKIGAQRRDF